MEQLSRDFGWRSGGGKGKSGTGHSGSKGCLRGAEKPAVE